MELDELQCQESVRQELITAETNYQTLKRDYDKLAVEHQQVCISRNFRTILFIENSEFETK